MSYSDEPGPRGNAPPHIRLNSGTNDAFAENPSVRSQMARASSSRSLIPQSPGIRPGNAGSLYNQPGAAAESSELLLPPKKFGKSRRYRDEESPVSPSSERSSRRSSWDSQSDSVRSRNSMYGAGPFASPFDDSRAPSRAGSDDDGLNTQTVSEKYNILPSAGLLLFPEDVEKDDYLHNPDPNDKDRDTCGDMLSRRSVLNLGGLGFIIIGIFFLFIGYPVLTYFHEVIQPEDDGCTNNPLCINVGHSIDHLKNIRTKLIDDDTPLDAMTRNDRNGKKQVLVFSDEFNVDGRTFYEGDDSYFQAMDFWYGVTQDLEWYDPDAATTNDGVLELKFDAFQNHGLNYRSGMLQSWNQMCFTGGYIEASISLPGSGDTIGFWPGFWTMGNLGRPGYAASTDGMWPYSYDDICDAGITANQSQTDGTSSLPGMRLPACTCDGEDHPNPGVSRSAPEIDALEASVGYLDPPSGAAIGEVSQSCQIAPFDLFWQPDLDYVEIYDHTITKINSYQGGVFQQAISGLTHLNNKWYDGNQYQTYAFEYEPGSEGYVTWFVGKDETWTLHADALRPNGNVGQRVIPKEPMAMVMNFGMSNGFAALNMTGLGPLMPATMRFDYIRIYQDEDNVSVTCDPPGYPTTQYIAKHKEAYTNPNITLWKQTDFTWPKNDFVNDCKASKDKV